MKNFNKGLAPIIAVIVVAVIVGVGAFVFYQQKKNSGPPLSKEAKELKKEIEVNCKYDQDFCRYSAKMATVYKNGFSAVSEHTYEGKVTKSDWKQDNQGNMEFVNYIDGKEQSRTIIFNKDTYMKNAGEKEWLMYPASKEEKNEKQTGIFDIEAMKEQFQSVNKNLENNMLVKKVGNEACGKYNCVVYEISMAGNQGASLVAFDTNEYLMRKMEFTSENGKSTITYDYAQVTITKPSPVKTMPSTEEIMKDSGIDMEKIQEMMKNADQPPAENPEEAPVEE